jgi:hypothetical protein
MSSSWLRMVFAMRCAAGGFLKPHCQSYSLPGASNFAKMNPLSRKEFQCIEPDVDAEQADLTMIQGVGTTGGANGNAMQAG